MNCWVSVNEKSMSRQALYKKCLVITFVDLTLEASRVPSHLKWTVMFWLGWKLSVTLWCKPNNKTEIDWKKGVQRFQLFVAIYEMWISTHNAHNHLCLKDLFLTPEKKNKPSKVLHDLRSVSRIWFPHLGQCGADNAGWHHQNCLSVSHLLVHMPLFSWFVNKPVRTSNVPEQKDIFFLLGLDQMNCLKMWQSP